MIKYISKICSFFGRYTYIILLNKKKDLILIWIMFQTIWTATNAFTEQNYTALKKACERYSYFKKVVYSICLKYVFFNLDSVALFEKEIHVLTK